MTKQLLLASCLALACDGSPPYAPASRDGVWLVQDNLDSVYGFLIVEGSQAYAELFIKDFGPACCQEIAVCPYFWGPASIVDGRIQGEYAQYMIMAAWDADVLLGLLAVNPGLAGCESRPPAEWTAIRSSHNQ